MTRQLILPGADDMHHHLRDGEALKCTVPHAAAQFRRCIVMPNLKPPVTTTDLALEYYERIVEHIPDGFKFQPLMTLYLTDRTSPEEVIKAQKSGKVFAVKYYPAGATTNSDYGVTDIKNVYLTLETMATIGMPLLIHGEVTDQTVDVFDREAAFIEKILKPLVDRFSSLKIVMEHITTRDAVEFINNSPDTIGATITCQHLLFNRNAIFQGGLRPHKYCLPVLKREEHRLALLEAVKSGSPKFFMGTDSAPHAKNKKQSDCGCAGIYSAHAALELYAEAFESINSLHLFKAFACENGAKFYGLKLNESNETVLSRSCWTVPASYPFDGSYLVPLKANEVLRWKKQN